MAIFSLNHSYIGKSHRAYKPGMARAHINYITRQSTCTKLIGERMPTERQDLKKSLHQAEIADRKNARVIDKLMLALPIELTPEQREQLIRDYCEHVTQGRAGWVAAIHDKGKDAHNPHAHIVLRDRDAAGQKVMHTTAGKKVIAEAAKRGITLDAMSPTRFREEWERIANLALERAGVAARIDRRSLKEQGIDNEPGIHVGPKDKAFKEKDYRPSSKPTQIRRMRHRVPTPIVIDYQAIDGGRTRGEHNEEIKRRNRQRGRSGLAAHGFEWTDHGGMAAQQRSALSFHRYKTAQPQPWTEPGARKDGPRDDTKSGLDEHRIPGGPGRGRDGPDRDR